MLPPRVDRVKKKLCVLWGYFYIKKEQSLLHKKFAVSLWKRRTKTYIISLST